MMRASTFLDTAIAKKDLEYKRWAELTLGLWKEDPCLHADFDDVVSFFDYAFSVAETLIRSVAE